MQGVKCLKCGISMSASNTGLFDFVLISFARRHKKCASKFSFIEFPEEQK